VTAHLQRNILRHQEVRKLNSVADDGLPIIGWLFTTETFLGP